MQIWHESLSRLCHGGFELPTCVMWPVVVLYRRAEFKFQDMSSHMTSQLVWFTLKGGNDGLIKYPQEIK